VLVGPSHCTRCGEGTADRQLGVPTAAGATGTGARRNRRRSSLFSELRVIALVMNGESTMATSFNRGSQAQAATFSGCPNQAPRATTGTFTSAMTMRNPNVCIGWHIVVVVWRCRARSITTRNWRHSMSAGQPARTGPSLVGGARVCRAGWKRDTVGRFVGTGRSVGCPSTHCRPDPETVLVPHCRRVGHDRAEHEPCGAERRKASLSGWATCLGSGCARVTSPSSSRRRASSG